MTDLTNPIYNDETAAREHLEAIRWVDGVSCPLCGGLDRVKALGGTSMGDGWYHCGDCRRKFTVRTGTIYERSHIPLYKWVLATHLMSASKKGMSAHQLHRMLGITYKSAWFMAMRIREAMRPLNSSEPMGGSGKVVEADETYIGGKETNKHVSKRKRGNLGGKGKEVAFALVERGGKVRSFHVADVTGKTLRPILVTQISRDTTLITDEAGQYRNVGKEFADHQKVNHGIDEYVRGEAHTNTVEGYFSILKRSINGTYHHVSSEHLKRYLGEFDFRYNTRASLNIDDNMRAIEAIKGAEGKRLTYRRTNQA
ncbi:MAG: IS1595 family transposase [Proteobacteria bacterium]|nr:IS1595 family transposase [Pseudomonadota bacterium]